jgi:folate-binding protein YgfZ
MTFKTNLPAAGCAALGGFGLLQLEGPDSERFLQAQSMNDVAALKVGHWQWNGLLTARGRVVALFALLREADDRFLLVLPDHPVDELLPVLQRFVFRSKVKLRADGDRVAAAGPVGDPLPPREFAASPDDGLHLDLGSGAGRRTLRILASGHPALAPGREEIDRAWTAADLAHGFPRLPASQRDAWTPQMLSLERFAAFSLAKGCYPGQEIVARTHYLGAAKRGLARLSAAGPLTPGQPVLDAAGRSRGTVVCTAETTEGCEALAVVAIEAMGHPLRTESAPLASLPLLPVYDPDSRTPG